MLREKLIQICNSVFNNFYFWLYGETICKYLAKLRTRYSEKMKKKKYVVDPRLTNWLETSLKEILNIV